MLRQFEVIFYGEKVFIHYRGGSQKVIMGVAEQAREVFGKKFLVRTFGTGVEVRLRLLPKVLHWTGLRTAPAVEEVAATAVATILQWSDLASQDPQLKLDIKAPPKALEEGTRIFAQKSAN